jgi:hypothetical protein
MQVDREWRYPSVLAFGLDIAKHATSETRVPSELASAVPRIDSSTTSSADDSRTKVDIPEIVATGRDAGMDTLEGEDSRPGFGASVVPIARFQSIPVVSTTARVQTETAIDLSFGGGKYGRARVEKTVDLDMWQEEDARSRAPEASFRVDGADDSRTSKILGLGRRKLLLVAIALAVVVLVAILVAVFSLRASRSRASTPSSRRPGLARISDSATRASASGDPQKLVPVRLCHRCPHRQELVPVRLCHLYRHPEA